MPLDPPDAPTPLVSVVMPTYNRAHFLPQAFASIQAQQLADWELIVVDDGSTDRTREAVTELAAGVPQAVRYLGGPNRGPYLARLAGAQIARGRYVAFFDSDDTWLPHHLADLIPALDANPDVGWGYGSCRSVELKTGRVLDDSNFYHEGAALPFLRLATRADGPFRVIVDPRAGEVAIQSGLCCGLQASVLRRAVFEATPFSQSYPMRIGEEVPMILMALKAGWRFGYLDRVHTLYSVHPENMTTPGGSAGRVDKNIEVLRAQAASLEAVAADLPLTARERTAVRRYMALQYFWRIGYALLWQNGRVAEALGEFRRGLRWYPWSLTAWKTYLLARVRILTGLLPAGAAR